MLNSNGFTPDKGKSRHIPDFFGLSAFSIVLNLKSEFQSSKRNGYKYLETHLYAT